VPGRCLTMETLTSIEHASDEGRTSSLATPAEPIVGLSHVTLRYPHGVTALEDVSLSVRAGERVCVLGPNGSGKSTLASVICGLIAPDEGDVTLVGQRCCVDGQVDAEAYQAARRKLGLVFQNPDDQIVTTVVAEDVAFGPENLGLPPEEIGKRVHRELHRVALLDYADADPTRLSGGQKQRVAIAGALAMHPRVLVLDEPGALLDMRGRRSIMEVMAKLARAGVTIVHVTHFMDEALAADHVIVLDKGRIALEGTPHDVFVHAERLARLGLERPYADRLAERLRRRGVDVPRTCEDELLQDAIVQGAHEKGFSAPARGSVRKPTETNERGTVVEVRDVSYSYGPSARERTRRKALDQVSLEVPTGSTMAIIGQTGSGKSTLLRLLCALDVPDSGSVVVDGISTARRRDRRRLHGSIGYVMQHPERQLFAETVRQDVSFGPRNQGLSEEEIERRTTEALELVGLEGKDDASPFELSGGQQRLCSIAGILAMRPNLLLLDEPTAGLDPRGRAALRAVLERVHEAGTTIVQVTHSMDDAALCDAVVVIDQSRVLMSGTPREVFAVDHETLLHDVGLGMPLSLTWARELEDRGVSGIGEPLDIDELADAIATALGEPQLGASGEGRAD
jgi:energy-coupling factor transporter ATPase